jgi:hypothetical protein
MKRLFSRTTHCSIAASLVAVAIGAAVGGAVVTPAVVLRERY